MGLIDIIFSYFRNEKRIETIKEGNNELIQAAFMKMMADIEAKKGNEKEAKEIEKKAFKKEVEAELKIMKIDELEY
jgi:hypothetical protein